MSDQAELLKLLKLKDKLGAESRLDFYDPYKYQVDFHNDKSKFRCLRAGNRIGKTHCGGAEVAYHLTGLYPEWWNGHRLEHPVKVVAGGKNNEKTRDIIQAALFGDPTAFNSWGTGWIPKRCLGNSQRKPGVPDAKYHVMVKHVSGGWSKVTLLAYDMGKETWMAHKADVNWLDEEPPEDILSQALRSVVDTGGRIFMTFTPENGTTQVIKQIEKSWSMHKAGWMDVSGDDFELVLDGENVQFETQLRRSGNVGHLTEEKVRDAIKAMMPHEIKMRAKGIPILGSGLIFPYDEKDISCAPFAIPDEWPRLGAIDFGFTHPTAMVWGAIDPATDTIYIFDGIRINKREISEVVAHVLMRPSRDIPVAWPHDGNKNFGMGGSIQKQYRDYGINLLPEHFTNPPKEGQKEGQGGINIMPGIIEMANRFNDGRLKVFNTLTEWFEEFRGYHHKDHKIVDKDDDYMAATRYLVQSIRFASKPSHMHRKPRVKRAIGG